MFGFNDNLSKAQALSGKAVKTFRVTDVSFAAMDYDAHKYFTIPGPESEDADVLVLIGVAAEAQGGNVLNQTVLHVGATKAPDSFMGITLYMQKNQSGDFDCAVHRYGNDTNARTFSAINFTVLYAKR